MAQVPFAVMLCACLPAVWCACFAADHSADLRIIWCTFHDVRQYCSQTLSSRYNTFAKNSKQFVEKLIPAFKTISLVDAKQTSTADSTASLTLAALISSVEATTMDAQSAQGTALMELIESAQTWLAKRRGTQGGLLLHHH